MPALLKLTPDLGKSIVDSVKNGLFDAQNALKHGIDITTLKSWVERGVDENAEEPFRSFAEAYIKASIELEERLVGTIIKASEPWEASKESEEVSSGTGDEDCDSDDREPEHKFQRRKSKTEKIIERGDWKAAGFFLERRWPLRWGITRQPEGGPKEAIKLPDAFQNRKRKVDELTASPPPELIKALAEKGWDLVKREEKKT